MIDLDQPWRLNPRVAVRPEPFGALLYHFGNRRLSFIKDPELLVVVKTLADHASARTAIEAAGVAPERVALHQRALDGLAASDVVEPWGSAS